MVRLAAFADEISPDPAAQVAALVAACVGSVEFRSVRGVNCLAMSDAEISEYARQLADAGVGFSALGSPVGKAPIDGDFGEHLAKFRRAVELCRRLGVPRMRVFSYYPPEGSPFAGDWSPWRAAVLDRLAHQVELASEAGVTLFHENEHRIYGDTPERSADLLDSINSRHFQAAYDAANYVVVGADPVAGWDATATRVGHLHLKDWARGGAHGVLLGHGDGRWDYALAGAKRLNFSGFAVLEPHLRGGGPTGGVTGADLFPAAVEAARAMLAAAGLAEVPAFS